MDDKNFKKIIYEPYLEAWKIAKLLQYLDETPDPDALWEKVVKERAAFSFSKAFSAPEPL